jgi:hypothetical protein
VANGGKTGSGGRRQYLQPVPAPAVEIEAAYDLDPVEFIESIYADLARDVGKSRGPLEVACGIADWLAMTTQMIISGVPDNEGEVAVAGFLGALIDVARRHATPQALAVLRALSVLPGTPAAEVAPRPPARAPAPATRQGVTEHLNRRDPKKPERDILPPTWPPHDRDRTADRWSASGNDRR